LNRQFENARQQLSLTGIPLTEREQKLVEHLRTNPNSFISSSEWASLAGISHDSALRDLNGLVQKKVLQKSNGRGRSTRYFLA
jgi:Fic family protein